MQTEPNREKRRVLKVFTIVEKPGQDKGIWLEIGVAVENRDSSFSVKLDAYPVNGMLHIRETDRKPETNRRNGDNQPQNAWRQNGGMK